MSQAKEAVKLDISNEQYQVSLEQQKKYKQSQDASKNTVQLDLYNHSLEENQLLEFKIIEEAYKVISKEINDPRVHFVSPMTMYAVVPHKDLPHHLAQSQLEHAQRLVAEIPKEVEIIICPIYDKRTTKSIAEKSVEWHWTALVCDRRRDDEIHFHFFDSFKHDDHAALGRKIAGHLARLLNHVEGASKKVIFKAHKTPQQNPMGNDADIYLVEISRVVAEKFVKKPSAAIQLVERHDIRSADAVRQERKDKLQAENELTKKGERNSYQTSNPSSWKLVASTKSDQRLVRPILGGRKPNGVAKMALNIQPDINSSTYHITIDALRGLPDETLLNRKDIVPAPAVKGVGTIVKLLKNGDVLVQVSPKRRLNSSSPLYLVKSERVKKNSRIGVGSGITYIAQNQVRKSHGKDN